MTYSELFIVPETERGHVSNVSLFDYLDQGRKVSYRYCIVLGVEAVVVHCGVDYKKEVFNNDRIIIRTTLDRVGNTSFTLKQTITNDQQEIMVAAEVVLTTIDRQTRKKSTVPNEVRSLLTKESILNDDHLAGINGIN